MKTLIFEDEKWENLTPLSYLHPVFELRCGKTLLLEKILQKTKNMEIGLRVREHLEPLVRKNYKFPVNDSSFFEDDLLIINGRWLMREKDSPKIEEESAYIFKDDIVYALINKGKVSRFWDGNFFDFLERVKKELPRRELNVEMMNYIWEFIPRSSEMLKEDFKTLNKKGVGNNFPSQSVIIGKEDDVYIDSEAEIHPYVVLDTTSGPIYIDRRAKIFPFARIEGPCYVGEDTHIQPGANIREGNSFGPVCRIGGEVEESIFQGYANKYHDGFIGHSFVGEWVNLGAITTNSDLKNDYSEVTVYHNGNPVKTGQLKVGSFFGDHTKTSIGTMLNTGTIAGVMCNITAGGILPKFFPSFIWFINGKYMKGFGIEMMIETAKVVKERRGKKLSSEEEVVIRKLYETTKEIRKKYIKKSRKIY